VQRELAEALEVLRRTQPGALLVASEDWLYLRGLARAEKAGIDDVLREYFPYATVRDGMFRVVETLFGLEFRRPRGAAPWRRW
jgi:Zn-dependent oligopeptidase